MRTALVCGFYGKDNAGDDAMLEVIASKLKKLGVKTIAVSHDPAKTRKDFGIEAIGWDADLSGIDYDFFVLGGGTQVQDYRLKGFEGLVKYFLKAKKPDVKTCLLSIGATRLKTKKGRALARKLCLESDLIIVRDRESRKELCKAGVRKKIFVSADLTFAAKPGPAGGRRNAICFCPIPYYEIFELAPKTDRILARKLAEAIGIVAGQTNAEIFLLPFFKEYDTAFCREIKGYSNARGVKVLPYRPLGLALTKTFEKFDLVVGMRFHSLVFSAFMGKPFVAIAFTEKTKNFVNAFSWKRLSVAQGFSAEELARKTVALYRQRSKASKKLLAKRSQMRKKAELAFRLFKENLLQGRLN